MPPGGERIISTSDGDVLGSTWGKPAPPQHRTTPPQAHHHVEPNSHDTTAAHSRARASSPQRPASTPAEPTTTTATDPSRDDDIIGHRRRCWAPPTTTASTNAFPPTPTTTSNKPTDRAALPSRHAATTTGPHATATTTPLTKIPRLIARLRWKSHTLLYTHHLALTLPATAHAAPMFQLDFFEWYTLLERILVLLLAFFRISVSPAGAGRGNGVGGGTWSNHRYHEAVLEALEQGKLHEVLGSGEVAAALRRAKGYRNRWKGADEVELRGEGEGEGEAGEIRELGVEGLVECVLGGLERAWGVVVVAGEVQGEGEGEGRVVVVDEDMVDAPWEAVGDAMEDVMEMDVE